MFQVFIATVNMHFIKKGVFFNQDFMIYFTKTNCFTEEYSKIFLNQISKIFGSIKGASTPSNIASNIAGNVEHVQLSAILIAIFSYLEGEIDYNLAKTQLIC